MFSAADLDKADDSSPEAGAATAFGFCARLAGVSVPFSVYFADLLPRLAHDFTGNVLWFGSSPAFISVDEDRSRIVDAPDLFGACCCRNARHIELDVA